VSGGRIPGAADGAVAFISAQRRSPVRCQRTDAPRRL